MKKNLLSLSVIAIFLVMATASAVNKIHNNAFNYHNNVESDTTSDIYIIKNDGSKLYGKKVSYTSGLLMKNTVHLDDEKFPSKEVRGFMKNGTYFTRNGGEYIQRIVHGKINVYVQFTDVQTTSQSSTGRISTRNYTRADHYAQLGDKGPLVALAGQKEIKEMVSDCPKAVAMADLSNGQMRKAIKANPNYLNSIFDVYNNGCK